jgi:hypothetical protein
MKSDCCLAKLLMRPQNLIQSRPRATRSTSSSSPATMRRSRSLYTCTCRSTTMTTQERMCDGVSRTGRCKVGGRVQFAFMAGYAHISIGWVGCRPESESGKETQVDVGALRDGGNDNARTCMRARGAYQLRYWKPLSPARSNEVGLRVARPGRHSYTDWLK